MARYINISEQWGDAVEVTIEEYRAQADAFGVGVDEIEERDDGIYIRCEQVAESETTPDNPAERQTMTAQELIDRSIRHTEITHAEFAADIAEELAAASENGGTRNDCATEYWGVTDSGDEWRVHLDHAAEAE